MAGRLDPLISIKASAKGIATKAAYFRSEPFSRKRGLMRISHVARKKTMPVTTARCDPDMDRICVVPVLRKRSFVASSMSVVSPIVRARMTFPYAPPLASILSAQ
jgi:hypothetical protein